MPQQVSNTPVTRCRSPLAFARRTVRWPAAIGSLVSIVGWLPCDGQEPAPIPVSYRLGDVQARPGETVVLPLEVFTTEPIRKLTIAVDFDERYLQVREVRRVDSEAAPVDTPQQRSTSLDNADLVDGNQSSEGWVYVELFSLGGESLVAAADAVTEIVEMEFVVRVDAPAVQVPLAFRPVGPVEVLDQFVFYTNSVYLDGVAEPEAIDLPPEALDDGSIQIIGEVGFFLRGDTDLSCSRELSDAVVTLRYLFSGGSEPPCLDAADADDSGTLELSDAVFSLQWMFASGRDFPEPLDGLGEDPSLDHLDCIGGYREPGDCGSPSGGS